MGEDSFTEEDVLRALEIANNHLEEAENVLWAAATQAESPEQTTDVEAVTQSVWDAQHDILDLKRELEQHHQVR